MRSQPTDMEKVLSWFSYLILNWEYCWCVFILAHGVYYKREYIFSRLLVVVSGDNQPWRGPGAKAKIQELAI